MVQWKSRSPSDTTVDPAALRRVMPPDVRPLGACLTRGPRLGSADAWRGNLWWGHGEPLVCERARVVAHSITAAKGEGRVENGNDKVVGYKSAHIDGVESELVINSGHTAQSNPRTVEEVCCILLLRAADTCEQTGVACIGAARDIGRSTKHSQV